MDYLFENLGPERFQQFCQSLLLREFPTLQCFPIAQPDGGRDAVYSIRGTNNRDFIVFQVKYGRKPMAEKEPHKWLIDIIDTEAPKIRKLIPEGAGEYYLLTNIPGTAHLGSGSVDRVQEILGASIDIPSQCWWRDDLSRRLDNAWDIKWSYPELMSGNDVLRCTLESNLGEHSDRRTAAIRTFVAMQFAADEEVRFKQVDLQNHLLDLFIDVPIRLRPSHNNDRYHRSRVAELMHLGIPKSALFFPFGASDEAEMRAQLLFPMQDEPPAGAAELLLSSALQQACPQIVLEGAPGQGKSTITQYVCQVYRMKILGMHEKFGKLPHNHQIQSIRVPFRIDLRDLATWFGKQDPFSEDSTTPDGWAKSLESFLAALVKHASGGIDFNVADLHAVAKKTAILLVLDGLDEVADISRRREIVSEITSEGV